MSENDKKIDWSYKRKALISMAIGTGVGLITYMIFLYFNIAIFGWNLGLIFAPLVAGYVETVIANRIIGENIGAISAFILFIYTTFYSFILKNQSLGVNFITAGSIIVILQAAFPTLINYILLVVMGGIFSNFIKTFQKILNKITSPLKHQTLITWEGTNEDIEPEIFDEDKSNQKLNSLGFYFITSSDIKDKKHEIIGTYHSEVILEKEKGVIHIEPENYEKRALLKIKEGKDECLIKLAEQIKENGGNGVLDLSLNYFLNGLGGERIQISAMGMGIKIIT